MSVYTPVSQEQLAGWLTRFDVGAPRDIRGIAEGIQNSNFFIDTDAGRYVLTLYERVEPASLPFYLALMAHLAAHGVLCPRPLPARNGTLLGTLNGKPAALFSCLSGSAIASPAPIHCAAIGSALAKLHLAGADFPAQPHPRGRDWHAATAARVLPRLDTADRQLLLGELEHQQRTEDSLPAGIIHADLFRDNVLFEGEAIGGLLDFYFAGHGDFLFDLAIVANDWCGGDDGRLDPARAGALTSAYESVRVLTPDERTAWPGRLRAAALRFWLSRLEDFHFPVPGETVTVRDPATFRHLLLQRAAHPEPYRG